MWEDPKLLYDPAPRLRGGGQLMRYMQIESGQKLHLVYEAGEGMNPDKLIPAGRLSAPICGRGFRGGERYCSGYRMTINVPLANACKNCLRVWEARHGG